MSAKHHVAIFACARWETAYLTEWLMYHQSIGFDHVYLYCNDDDPTDQYGEVLPFCRGNAPFVTFHHFPYQGQQFYMMMHALYHYKDAAEWIAFLDVDEFLTLPHLDNIKEFLRRCPARWDSINFNWSFFGNNGHARRPSGSVLRNYTRRQQQLHQSTKTLTRSAKIDLSRITRKVFVWHGWDGVFGPDFVAVNVLGEPMDQVNGTDGGESYVRSSEIQLRIRNSAVVNHYAFKSADDFAWRAERGLQGEFNGQANWMRLTESDAGEAALSVLNAVEDTYLADYWQRFLRAGQAARIVPPAHLPNVALGKQADQSSISQWSRGATTAEDAAGAINGRITGQAQCHTAREREPWWLVDLAAPHLIYEVRLFNRVDEPGYRARLGAFRIEIGRAPGAWSLLYGHDPKRLVGGADGYPLIVRLASPTEASRLRVTAEGDTVLHLDQVEIYGIQALDTGMDVAQTEQFHPPTTRAGAGAP